ncbi:MAG: hypothetical protein SGBAC_011588 [Bacillariaceae sp.]
MTLRPSRSTSALHEQFSFEEQQIKDVTLSESMPFRSTINTGSTGSTGSTGAIKIIFSDIDGSLIHYPKSQHNNETQEHHDDESNRILALPPSATGLRGAISSRTLVTCRDLRVEKGVKLVLVTGARTSTLLNRLPFLPKADAYCTEAGGRIFYPTDVDCCHNEGALQSQYTYTPHEYSGANIASEDLKPFGLREDMAWRKRMEDGGAGVESYKGNEVFSSRCDGNDDDDDDGECLIDYESTDGFPFAEDEVHVSKRQGNLWNYANQLVEQEGFVLDTKSYSTCFRVNKKHQTNDKFNALLAGDIHPPDTRKIGTSTNLGCIDFYPAVSGKKWCCQYIADELGFNLATESVCICDDDNDIEMALACSHSYIPSLTSERMVDVEQIVTSTADMHGCEVGIVDSADWYPPTITYEEISKAIGAMLSVSGEVSEVKPGMGTEDFGFGKGSGTDPPTNLGLHHLCFALDESIRLASRSRASWELGIACPSHARRDR